MDMFIVELNMGQQQFYMIFTTPIFKFFKVLLFFSLFALLSNII